MATIDAPSIIPISFQILSAEDGNTRLNSAPGKTVDQERSTIVSEADQKRNALSNFSLRPTYPAVTFDRICFSVNKSQQQSNLLADCVSKTKQCLSFGLASGSAEQKVDILKSINLNVPTGCIFGLLGPSSCGKTTLLRCLVGLLEPSSGSINLFGQETRTFGNDRKLEAGCCGGGAKIASGNSSKVPGSNVGYMPQDLGLYEDFTIRQLLTMFGQYMGMDSGLIKSRIAFMGEFLDLPDSDREIVSLSGGQKRRVSFAIACLHMPPLLILDEPTVGVDPLLRQSIWKYLRHLADEQNKTIIITTHYIEEAAQADQVALMRSGEILIQDNPRRIMQSNGCNTLEEAFLKICNQVSTDQKKGQPGKLRPQQLKFDWHHKIKSELSEIMDKNRKSEADCDHQGTGNVTDSIVRRLQEKAQEKLAIFEYLQAKQKDHQSSDIAPIGADVDVMKQHLRSFSKATSEPGGHIVAAINLKPLDENNLANKSETELSPSPRIKKKSIRFFKRSKLVISEPSKSNASDCDESRTTTNEYRQRCGRKSNRKMNSDERIRKNFSLMWALLYKNYRRNVNSLPLLAFQFMLPIIQMISFSLCIGGRPTQIGLGLVNHDQQLISYEPELKPGSGNNLMLLSANSTTRIFNDADSSDQTSLSIGNETELLSTRYLSFLDESMLAVRAYENISDALNDVRKGKLWAAMEIGPNFTRTISRRFDLENFYQLDLDTIKQSVIKLYPDRSNKVLDMICHRSLVNSYRKFLLDEFEHFRRLPIEVKEPIFDIKPNLISNSMDGYTESIAAGLLASLTYIMAAGLTTFIMVVERSAGILERTYTSGISPTAYLLAHAFFRSLVMMLQIGLVLFLTFYLLEQPLLGSIWLAYLMLMTLNLTGIAYGLLISSLVSDQNGAALTIVSSLVVKITMSGILWPFEAIPRWLRAICYVQPLTMPVQALKSITLKGNGLDDRTVYLGFVVSLTWLAIFLTISAKRFKFYQH